jgi:hypothetical protein
MRQPRRRPTHGTVAVDPCALLAAAAAKLPVSMQPHAAPRLRRLFQREPHACFVRHTPSSQASQRPHMAGNAAFEHPPSLWHARRHAQQRPAPVGGAAACAGGPPSPSTPACAFPLAAGPGVPLSTGPTYRPYSHVPLPTSQKSFCTIVSIAVKAAPAARDQAMPWPPHAGAPAFFFVSDASLCWGSICQGVLSRWGDEGDVPPLPMGHPGRTCLTVRTAFHLAVGVAGPAMPAGSSTCTAPLPASDWLKPACFTFPLGSLPSTPTPDAGLISFIPRAEPTCLCTAFVAPIIAGMALASRHLQRCLRGRPFAPARPRSGSTLRPASSAAAPKQRLVFLGTPEVRQQV